MIIAAPVWYDRIVEAYHEGNLNFVHEYGLVFIDLMKDLDRILGTNKNFMLGPWLESAKATSTSDKEMANFEFNARNQITLWGPDGQILDYAGECKICTHLCYSTFFFSFLKHIAA